MCRYALIILLSLAFFPSLSFATDCTPTADCAAMGYTQSASDCSGKNMVKCPKDSSKVFCPSSSGTSSSGTKITCNIGSLIYGDGNCYDFYDAPANIKPVGVVFNASLRLAVALSDINSSGVASSCSESDTSCPVALFSSNCNIPTLEDCVFTPRECQNQEWNCIDAIIGSCGADGNSNTTQMLSASGCGTAIAAKAVRAFVPDGCSATFCQKGKWFIPSMREWQFIYNNLSKIRTPMNLLLNSSVHVVNLLNEKDYLTSTDLYESSNFYSYYGQIRLQSFDINGDVGLMYINYATTSDTARLRPVVKY